MPSSICLDALRLKQSHPDGIMWRSGAHAQHEVITQASYVVTGINWEYAGPELLSVSSPPERFPLLGMECVFDADVPQDEIRLVDKDGSVVGTLTVTA